MIVGVGPVIISIGRKRYACAGHVEIVLGKGATMIGIDQEPDREALAALNGALGEGNYQVQYEQTEHGVRAIVRTHEKPARTWNTRFTPGLAREQVDAVWQEFTARIAKSSGTVESDEAEQARIAARADAEGTPETELAKPSAPTLESVRVDLDKAPAEGYAGVDYGKGSHKDPARR